MKLCRPQPRREPRPKAVEVAAVQAEQPERRFNPEVDISPEIWARAQTVVDFTSTSAGPNYLDRVEKLALIFPDHRENLNLGTKASDDLLSKFRIYEADHIDDTVIHLARRVAILFPDRRAELGLDRDFSRKAKKNIKDSWGAFSRPDITFEAVISYLILFPDCRAELKLDQKKYLVLRKGMEDCRRAQDWGNCLRIAAGIVLLFPEYKNELNLEEVLKRAKQELRSMPVPPPMHYNDFNKYVDLAYALSILTADDAKITGQGLKLTRHRTSPLSPAPELPSRQII